MTAHYPMIGEVESVEFCDDGAVLLTVKFPKTNIVNAKWFPGWVRVQYESANYSFKQSDDRTDASGSNTSREPDEPNSSEGVKP